MNIFWQEPQYIFLSVVEVFFFIGQLEFFYDQSPDAMRCLCSALSLLTTALGNYLSSFILSMVMYFIARGRKPGWIPENLNEGHLDYFFWLLAGLSFLNMLVYIISLLEDMDSESAHMVAVSKVPMLKPGEFEIWRMGIEQYIQMIDYALWEVIENGNTAPKSTVVECLKFNFIKDDKLLLEAIEKRFGGNAATKKTDKNKPELETMSMDDLYNNFKVYKPEVKGTSSSNTSTQNMAFVSSNNSGSTNEAVNTAHGVSAASTQVSAANSTNVDNLSDDVIYAFFSSQPNNPQLTNEDQYNPHLYDCPKWTATTAIRGDTLPESAELQGIKTTRIEKAQEESDQAEEGPNYALMAYSSSNSDSEVSNDSTCSKSCLETVKTLKSQYDQLHKDFKKSELSVIAYKTGLESVEEKLEVYKENESIYSQDINVLKFEIKCKDIAIRELRKKLEKAQQEKDSIQFNVNKFENASKSLDKLIDSQIVDNCKKGLGYNAVPPDYTRNFIPPTPDLSFTGLEEFTSELVVIKPVVENSEAKASEAKPIAVRKNNGAPIIDDWVSESEEEDVPQAKIEKNSVSQMCDKKNGVLFNDTGCIVLSLNFKLIDESQVLLRVPRKNNMYSVDLKNIVPKRGLTCLFAKATSDESKLWHKRLGHLNFKTMDKLVKGNLVRGLPSKLLKMKKHVLLVKRESNTEPLYSAARTPQQNGVAKRRNRTLIESAKTMLVDSKLPTTFWAEAANTACYVQNKVLVVKPHNKTPYKCFHGRTPTLSFIRPFGCPVTILNTIDHLGKFDGKADEGFFVGYSLNSKAFRVFNSTTRIVEKNLHIRFSESTPNVVGSGLDWLFDIDALTRTINYEPIIAGTQPNGFAGTKASDNEGQARKETEPVEDYIFLPLWTADPPFSQDPKSSQDDGSKPSSDDGKKVDEALRKDSEGIDQEKEDNVNSTNNVNAAGIEVNDVGGKTSIELLVDPNMPALEDYSIFDSISNNQEDGAEADMNNLDTTIQVSPNPTTRIHNDHPLDQVIGDFQSATQTRNMSKNLKEHGFVSTIQQRTNHKDLQNCLFACFLSQEEPKKVIHALKDPTRLVSQGYTQEEGIDYNEVFASVARIEAIRLFLAYASFKDFVVYQMDVKSAFLYGKIEEEVYVCQPPGFEDLDFPDRVYKVEKALYGLHQAPRTWYETLLTYLLDNGFQRGKIDKTLFIKRYKGDILLVQVYVDDIIFGSTKKELCNAFEKLMHEKFQMSSMGELTFFLGLQVQQKKDGIFISQDKYVGEILKKFRFTEVKTASTLIETQKPLLKDEDGEKVDVHMYRLMIGSLMYLTSSKPGIMFAVCACARYQVNPKVSHLHAVKKIFRYLKGQLKLGLWYPKDSSFDLVAYTDSDMLEQAWIGNARDNHTEASLRSDFLLADEMVCCLLATNFEQLYTDGNTAWNEFSSTMASSIIYLAKNQKFNFSKLIFESIMKNSDNVSGKFLMYPSGPTEPVADEVVYKERDDSLVRAATTASSLEAEQDSGNIIKTRSKETLNEPSSPGTSSGVNTPRSDEDSMKLKELMEFCTKLQQRGRYGDDLMFDTSDLAGEEVFVAEQGVLNSKKNDVVSTAGVAITVSAAVTTVPITPEEITLA
ncbi:putative ribonuclease H-like domain-containing protein [Tanacetum coccineum]|uniref:Ribonuclease H-like domain-containing protein n=1 Tax=Tanacetum coccineum TaxID=301880 RepID=A0ABQ5BHP6_9ASTR